MKLRRLAVAVSAAALALVTTPAHAADPSPTPTADPALVRAVAASARSATVLQPRYYREAKIAVTQDPTDCRKVIATVWGGDTRVYGVALGFDGYPDASQMAIGDVSGGVGQVSMTYPGTTLTSDVANVFLYMDVNGQPEAVQMFSRTLTCPSTSKAAVAPAVTIAKPATCVQRGVKSYVDVTITNPNQVTMTTTMAMEANWGMYQPDDFDLAPGASKTLRVAETAGQSIYYSVAMVEAGSTSADPRASQTTSRYEFDPCPVTNPVVKASFTRTSATAGTLTYVIQNPSDPNRPTDTYWAEIANTSGKKWTATYVVADGVTKTASITNVPRGQWYTVYVKTAGLPGWVKAAVYAG